MSALLGLVVVVLVVQAVQLRRLSDRLAAAENDAATAIARLTLQAHTHPRLRRHDHEPAVSRLLDGERDASQRRGQ